MTDQSTSERLTWTLIMRPNGAYGQPVIVDGFKSREDAARAGRIASGDPSVDANGDYVGGCGESYSWSPTYVDICVVPKPG